MRVLGYSVLATLLTLGIAFPAAAGGLYVNEFSTASQGNAGAGRGAWAPDASVTLHNPASMTQLEDHAFATGFSLAAGRVEFDPAPGTPLGPRDGGNQVGVAPLASFSYVHRISDRVRAGLSFYSLSGSVLDPDNAWTGRQQMTELSLLTISVSPSIAFEVTDWLSIGGGPILSYASLEWSLRTAFPPGPTESDLRLKDFDDLQAGGRVGALLTPTEALSISVFYNAEIEFELSGGVDGPVGVAPNLDVELPLPQFVEVSTALEVTDRLTLLATFAWEDWSEADDLRLDLAVGTIQASTGFEDTYKIGLGLNYALDERWLLQTGVMFDTSTLQNKRRTAAIPIDQQIRVAAGVQYAADGGITVGANLVYVNLGQGEVRQGTVVGDYRHNDLIVAGLTLAFDALPWSGRASF